MEPQNPPSPAKEGEIETLSTEIQILTAHKESAFNWQQRRHDEWTENYTLYRDKVIINRLTQRQSVNIPLMKTSIRTALKDNDDPPLIYFEELGNDKDREILYNQYFDDSMNEENNKLVLKDIVDKKQVYLYGRSFKKLNIVNGKFFFEIIDPQDILVDRFADPVSIDTARYLCHQHIFVPISTLVQNEDYDEEAVKSLKSYMATRAGPLKADENLQNLTERNDRMRKMGVPDIDNPILGETYIELNEHYVMKFNKETGEEEYFLYVTAEGRETLLSARLEEVIGPTRDHYWRKHLPFTTWADDVERTDFWSDGMADIIRTPNKILNSWFSQLVENRTLRNFGMTFYKQTDGFMPQSYEPKPFGWYPLPDDPDKFMKHVDIPDLGGNESLDEITFLMQIAEKATATTSIQQGVSEERKITLGEVELLMKNAQDRVKSSAIYYNDSWKEFGHKFVKMIEAADDLLDDVKLYKKGRYNNKMYSRDVSPQTDLRSSAGYKCKVILRDEREAEQTNTLQKLNAVKVAMPDNQPLIEIYQKKLLEFAGLSPEEMKQVIDFEKQKQTSQFMPGVMPPGHLMNQGIQPALKFGQPQNRTQLPAQIPAMMA